MLFLNGKLRLTLPEAYATHRDIIEWNAQFSEDRIPDRAVGLDPVGVALMRWALKSWDRVRFLNTYLAGTLLPRVQLDLIPGLACAAPTARSVRMSLDQLTWTGGDMSRSRRARVR